MALLYNLGTGSLLHFLSSQGPLSSLAAVPPHEQVQMLVRHPHLGFSVTQCVATHSTELMWNQLLCFLARFVPPTNFHCIIQRMDPFYYYSLQTGFIPDHILTFLWSVSSS